MKRLSGVDAMLLYSEAPEIHMHTLKIGVLDVSEIRGGYTFESFRDVAYPRLLGLEPLRYQLVATPLRFHHPKWREHCPIDMDYHIRRVGVPAPGGRRELDKLIGEIAAVPLSRERPLWRMYVVEGVGPRRGFRQRGLEIDDICDSRKFVSKSGAFRANRGCCG
jgi:diacylglycerol O-acyltransferase / wax synthase